MRHHVDIMETEIGQAEPSEKFERFIKLMVGARLINWSAVPWTIKRACSEHVKAIPAECMPIAYCHTQMLGHGFAHDNPVLVITTIGERIGGFEPFEFDGFDVGKVTGGHDVFS
jgi:hypothetical protein